MTHSSIPRCLYRRENPIIGTTFNAIHILYLRFSLEEVLADIRYGMYYGDIEMQATIYQSIVHWENIRVNLHVVMNDPVISQVRCST